MKNMIPYIDSISTLIYEERFNFNSQIARTIINSLEATGFTLEDFLRGVSIVLDERDQLEAAEYLERAAEILNQIKE